MTTQRFAVIGDPVHHSASPRMHTAAYAALGMDCTYEAIHALASDLPRLIARLREGELAGLNVTLPHKRDVLDHVDVIDDSARSAGAANTLVRTPSGQIVAHNTDIPAIALELRELAEPLSQEEWRRAHALVLGTGATARSAVIALGRYLSVAQITVRGRALGDSHVKAAFFGEIAELLEQTGAPTSLSLEAFAPRASTDRDVGAIVQATSLGMDGGGKGEIARDVVAWGATSPKTVALDVVYSKGVTPFLEAASAHGMKTADGRGMLARQGALAFELWFGRSAPLSVMRDALAA
jgi:shikimate dehydrogenase